MADVLLADMLRERRSDRRWRTIRRSLLVSGVVGGSLAYAMFYATALGYKVMPSANVVGVVRIEGEIARGTLASADRVIPVLRSAFEAAKVRAVVLAIDSPGGAPVEAERIYRAIEAFRQAHPKPVLAVIQNIGASAAYMIALHTDRIYAARYSMVGSVGAVLSSWDFSRALERVHVSQRVYASGELKAMLNPFLPATPAAERKAKELVRGMGESFRSEVAASRGKRLLKDVDYATGEVWSGTEAMKIGLVDEIGTLDEVVAQRYGLRTHDLGPMQSPFHLGAQVLAKAAMAMLGPGEAGGVRWW
jgi:protease IV